MLFHYSRISILISIFYFEFDRYLLLNSLNHFLEFFIYSVVVKFEIIKNNELYALLSSLIASNGKNCWALSGAIALG